MKPFHELSQAERNDLIEAQEMIEHSGEPEPYAEEVTSRINKERTIKLHGIDTRIVAEYTEPGPRQFEPFFVNFKCLRCGETWEDWEMTCNGITYNVEEKLRFHYNHCSRCTE